VLGKLATAARTEFAPKDLHFKGTVCRYGFKSAVGFVPSGFTFQKKADYFPVHEKPPWKIHLIPYSEHSSFNELQEFVKFLRPQTVIPTVGVSDKDDSSAHKMISHFRHLCDQCGAKRTFLGPLMAAADGSKQVSKPAHNSSECIPIGDGDAVISDSCEGVGGGTEEQAPTTDADVEEEKSLALNSSERAVASDDDVLVTSHSFPEGAGGGESMDCAPAGSAGAARRPSTDNSAHSEV
jgi:hypothetical protein